MFNFFNRKRPILFMVTWKFYDDPMVMTQEATSGGLASLDADPCIEILSVELV